MKKTQIVQEYIKDLSKEKSVLGIVLTGSFGRDSFDKFSDVDNVVVVDKKNRKVREGKFEIEGLLFDTRVALLEKLEKMSWTQDMYFAYLDGKIEYDSTGRIAKLIRNKKNLWKEELYKSLSFEIVYLSFIYRFSDNWRGLDTYPALDKYIDRREYDSSHKSINQALEHCLSISYLLNKMRIPDQKNKLRLLKSIDSLPKRINEYAKAMLIVNSNTPEDVLVRATFLSKWVDYIKDTTDHNFDISNSLYQYYLDNRE